MGDFFKNVATALFIGAVLLAIITNLTGCTSTVSHYDKDGKLVKVEEVTNFSRVMDGTNQKSQMLLIDGTYLGFEVSATAGENCTPGLVTKYARGKSAVVSIKDKAKLNNVSDIVEKFFAGKVNATASGVTVE